MGEPVRAGHASAEHASGDSTWVDPVPGPVATRRSSPASDGTQIPAWAGGPTGDGLTRAQPSSGTARIPAWAAPPKQERHSGADPAEADLVIGDIERASGLPFEFANIVQLREGTPGQQATAADRAFDRDAATEASADVLEHAATRFATGQPAQAPAHAADGFLPKLFAAGPAAEPVGELESALGSGGLGLGIELPAEHRARFEPQLDADLSGVRVHSGPAASRAAAARGARALTYGQHVVLGGNAVVDTPNGNELLAHELMHTVQQRTRTPSVLAAPKDENEMTTGPVTVRWWPKLGLLGATLNGIPWVTVRWEPSPARTTLNVQAKSVGSFGASVSGGSGPVLLPRPSLLGADGVGLRVQTRFPIKVLVNREAEARLAEGRTSPVRFVHEYSADGQRVEVNEELPQGSRSHEGTQFVSDTQDQAFDLLYNPEFGRAEQVPVRPTASSRPFAWRFGSRAQLEAWAAAHPDLWWVEGPPDGTTLQALHADEKRMAEVADQWRQQGGDTGVRTVYERGVAWPDLDSLYDLFYRTEYGAQEGPPGDAGECLVFRHNRASYGRVPLSHEEARAAWTQLETDETTGGMAGRIPRGSFMFVAARGQGTSVDLIGEQYLTLRARFFAGLEAKQDPADLLREPFMWSGFLRIALDRPMGGLDPALKRAFYMDSRLWDAAGASILADLSRDAKWEAIWAIDAAKQGVQIYANEEAAHRLVLTMAGMTSKERSNTAAFLGLEGQGASSVTTVLADREKAARVWMGETVDAVSTAGLVEAASSQSSKLERFQLQVENDDVEPLWVPGEFGDQIRARVYKKYGFTLSPASFPHEDTPDRLLAGGFGSELGFAFAHGAARESSSRRTRHLWLLVGSVVAGVVLVLVANAAGAAVAGLLFAEGTAGYVIVEVGISALVLTGASPATSTFILSGGKASAEAYAAAYGDPGEQYVWNVLTFGFFKALGAGVRALAVVGAGGEEAYAGSLAWKTAETGVRMGASGVAMYGIAGLQHRMHGKPMPTGTGRDELLFETGLSLVLMEVAGFAVRGPMKDLRDLVRDVRLGDKAPKIDTLLVEAQTLSKEVSAFAADPHTAGKRGQALLDRQVRLLESAKALIEELRATPRTGADIKDLQTRLDRFTAQIDAQLAAARGYALIGEANVRPVSFEEGNTEFTYDRTKQTQIEEFYTKAKAEVRSEGRTIFVTYQGKELVFRPATDTAAGIRPDGTRTPAAFDAWRAAVARRRAVLLDRAQERAHVDSDVEALRDADPAAMDEKVLSKAEGLLARVDRTLQKLGDPQPLGPIDKSGTDAEGWRLRLVEARRQLLARARVLGLLDEPEIVQLSRLGTGRQGLKENTLARHQEVVERARDLVDRVAAPRQAAAAATPEPDITALQAGLESRQADVMRRANIYGIREGAKYLEAVRPSKLRPGQRQSLEGLREAEARLEVAEARLDKLAKAALADAEAMHGKEAVDTARSDPAFKLWTDAQVGDALRNFAGARNKKGFLLTEDAIRGALWAARGPGPDSTRTDIPLDGLMRNARTADDLNFVLETYGRMRELSIRGSFDLLRRGAGGEGSWKGAVWQMEIARDHVGLDRIEGFEVKEAGREIDILLRGGGRIECKDWVARTWNGVKVRAQATADFEGATAGGTNPAGIRDIRWMFRGPPPRDPAIIRATIRVAFEQWIWSKRSTLSPKTVEALRAEFDAHPGLVSVPEVSRTGVVRPGPTPTSGIPPRRRDDEPMPPPGQVLQPAPAKVLQPVP